MVACMCVFLLCQFLSQKIPAFLLFWRATLELWPHLDGEHLWSANNYPISAKRGCSCSPTGALNPAYSFCTTASPLSTTPPSSRQLWVLPAPTSEAEKYLGGVVSEREKGGHGHQLCCPGWQSSDKRVFSGWDRQASPHTPGGQENQKKACSASKPLCHLGSSLEIRRRVRV